MSNLLPTESSSNMPNSIIVNKATITDTSDIAENLKITLLILKKYLATSINNVDLDDFSLT